MKKNKKTFTYCPMPWRSPRENIPRCDPSACEAYDAHHGCLYIYAARTFARKKVHEQSLLALKYDFQRLMEEEYERIRRYCIKLTGSVEEGEELCQEAFSRAFFNATTSDPGAPLPAWLYRVAKNAFLDDRRRKRSTEVSLTDLEENNEFCDVFFAGFYGDETTALEWQLEIFRAMKAISPRYALILFLKCIQGHTVKDCARMMRIEEDAAESLLRRARKAMIKALSHNTDE